MFEATTSRRTRDAIRAAHAERGRTLRRIFGLKD